MDDKIKQLLFKMNDKQGVFYLLSDQELDLIHLYFEVAHCSAGTSLFTEGDPGGYISFILSGKLEVKKETEFKGKQVVLGTLSSGSFIGESSLVNEKEHRAATAVALEDTDVIILRTDAFESLIKEYPEAGIKILKGLVKVISIRLLKAVEKLTKSY